MSSLTKKEIGIIESIVKNGCPTCKEWDGLMAQGYQWCTSNDIIIEDGLVSFDLSGSELDEIVDPVEIWCEICKTVWLDRRTVVANTIKNLIIKLDNGTTLLDPWKGNIENTTYPVENWRLEVTNKNTLLGYWEWVIHQKEANER